MASGVVVKAGEETYEVRERPRVLRKVNEVLESIGRAPITHRDIELISFPPTWGKTFRASVIAWVRLRETPPPRKKLPRRPTDKSSHVYFVRGGDMIEVGLAKDPAQRLRDLQVGSPLRLEILATIRGSLAVEKGIHARFKDLRSHGEWFRAEPPILEFIEEMKRRQSRDG